MSFKKVRMLMICLAGSFLAMPSAAIAGADSGFYVGAGAGDTTVKVSDSNFDESDTSYKIFGGYNIGFIPLVDFALEVSYVDFGKPSTATESVDVSGVNAFGLAGLSFGPLGLFAKAGIISWNTDVTVNGVSTEDSGTDPAYGLGARLAFGSFAIRAEYEVFDLENADLGMASVSGVITF
jgi:hypothetical protein